MHITHPKLRQWITQYQPIVTLSHIQSLLDWDMNVYLPPKASQGRAAQNALLTDLIAQRWQDQKLSAELEELQSIKEELTPDEQALLAMFLRSFKLYKCVPKELLIKKSTTTSQAFMAWHEAKQTDSFALFRPWLTELVSIDRLIADHLGYTDHPYDALVSQYDASLTTNQCSKLFQVLQPHLTQLLTQIQRSPHYTTHIPLINGQVAYALAQQQQLGQVILAKMGYDFTAGRLDIAPHPFCTDLGPNDTRITTRYLIHDFHSALSATMHEGGHALYSQGIPSNLLELMSGENDLSLSIHESQSRFWENHIGRSAEFLTNLTPLLHTYFPDQLSTISAPEIIKLFNNVAPGYIRIEADEVTYPLHIMLRFEIERDLINGQIQVAELPEIWRAKSQQYLGLTPQTDTQGVLQDVHWSYGNFGYFPTYAVGTLYAAQFANALDQDLHLATLLEQQDFGTILTWLRTAIHHFGPLKSGTSLIQDVSGEPLNPKYFTKYVQEKFAQIYDLPPLKSELTAS